MFGDGGRADGRAARLAGRRRAWGGNPEGEGGALVGRKRTRNGPDPLFPGVKIQNQNPFHQINGPTRYKSGSNIGRCVCVFYIGVFVF